MSGCRHGLKSCLLCEIEAAQPPRQYSAWDAVNVLQARIADQDAELEQLRTRVAELEHRTNDRQAAHNAQAAADERMTAALEARIANIESRLLAAKFKDAARNARIAALEEQLLALLYVL